MHHRREVNSIECSAVEQLDLAAATFFGGGAEQCDGEPQLIGDGRQREGSTHGR